MPVSLTDQIKCVDRELAMRRAVYARKVSAGTMKPEAARREYDAMQAVRDTLAGMLDRQTDDPRLANRS